jgi:integrase/recombinase XerD
MRTRRGTQEKTLSQYGIVVKDVLEALGADPSGYSASSIRTFILSRTKGKNRRAVKQVVSVTRVFLRYLIAQGGCRTGMDDAVPTFAMWRPHCLATFQRLRARDRCL